MGGFGRSTIPNGFISGRVSNETLVVWSCQRGNIGGDIKGGPQHMVPTRKCINALQYTGKTVLVSDSWWNRRVEFGGVVWGVGGLLVGEHSAGSGAIGIRSVNRQQECDNAVW